MLSSTVSHKDKTGQIRCLINFVTLRGQTVLPLHGLTVPQLAADPAQDLMDRIWQDLMEAGRECWEQWEWRRKGCMHGSRLAGRGGCEGWRVERYFFKSYINSKKKGKWVQVCSMWVMLYYILHEYKQCMHATARMYSNVRSMDGHQCITYIGMECSAYLLNARKSPSFGVLASCNGPTYL